MCLSSDRHPLVAVDVLDLFDQVLLGISSAARTSIVDFGSNGPSWERRTTSTSCPSSTRQVARDRDRLLLDLAVVADDHDTALATDQLDTNDTENSATFAAPFRCAGLEEFHDARQAVRNVALGHTTGVEGTHGALRAGLADGLCGDDADGLTELNQLVRRQGQCGATVRRGRRPVRRHQVDVVRTPERPSRPCSSRSSSTSSTIDMVPVADRRAVRPA